MHNEHIGIENLNRRQLPEAVDMIAQAFSKNPLALYAFEGVSPENKMRRLRRVYRSVMEIALQRGRVFVVRKSGRIVAAAVLYPPEHSRPSLLTRALSGVGAFTVGPRASGRYARYERTIRKLQPAEPHWYLFFLGVTPQNQGDGIGSAFVRHICRLADADKMPCYLETTIAEQVDFYQQNGFRLIQEKQFDADSGMTIHSMLRAVGS